MKTIQHQLLIFIILFLFSQCDNKPNPPKKLKNIPQSAFWAGGVDGGSWFKINKVISRDSFDISVYNDITGELNTNGIFYLDSICLIQSFDSLALIKEIIAYDGSHIILSVPNDKMHCMLIKKNKF